MADGLAIVTATARGASEKRKEILQETSVDSEQPRTVFRFCLCLLFFRDYSFQCFVYVCVFKKIYFPSCVD